MCNTRWKSLTFHTVTQLCSHRQGIFLSSVWPRTLSTRQTLCHFWSVSGESTSCLSWKYGHWSVVPSANQDCPLLMWTTGRLRTHGGQWQRGLPNEWYHYDCGHPSKTASEDPILSSMLPQGSQRDKELRYYWFWHTLWLHCSWCHKAPGVSAVMPESGLSHMISVNI